MRPLRATFIAGLCICYGIYIECMQHFFTGDRHFEWMDIMANTGGVLIGISLSKWLPAQFFLLQSKI